MPRKVTVISKRGCHICDDVVEAVRRSSPGSDVDVFYIDDDRELHDRYWLTIPVVLVEGKLVFDANSIGRDRAYLKRLETEMRAD